MNNLNSPTNKDNNVFNSLVNDTKTTAKQIVENIRQKDNPDKDDINLLIWLVTNQYTYIEELEHELKCKLKILHVNNIEDIY